MIKDSKIKVEGSFLISEQGCTMGKVLDGTECQDYWTQDWVNHSCPNHTICTVNHSILCPNLHQEHREFK